MKNYFLFITLLFIIQQSYSQKNGFGIHSGLAVTGIYDFANGLDGDFEPRPSLTLGSRYTSKIFFIAPSAPAVI